MVKNTIYCAKNDTKLIRCMKHFILEDFLPDLNVKMSEIKLNYSETNVNTDVSNITLAFKSVLNTCPFEIADTKRNYTKQKALDYYKSFKSKKTKHKLFRKLFKSNNSKEKRFTKII